MRFLLIFIVILATSSARRHRWRHHQRKPVHIVDRYLGYKGEDFCFWYKLHDGTFHNVNATKVYYNSYPPKYRIEGLYKYNLKNEGDGPKYAVFKYNLERLKSGLEVSEVDSIKTDEFTEILDPPEDMMNLLEGDLIMEFL